MKIIGPCAGCGVILTQVGAGRPRKRCAACSKSSTYMARLAARRVSAGVCRRCGDVKRPDRSMCATCLRYIAIAMAKHRAKHRVSVSP